MVKLGQACPAPRPLRAAADGRGFGATGALPHEAFRRPPRQPGCTEARQGIRAGPWLAKRVAKKRSTAVVIAAAARSRHSSDMMRSKSLRLVR